MFAMIKRKRKAFHFSTSKPKQKTSTNFQADTNLIQKKTNNFYADFFLQRVD